MGNENSSAVKLQKTEEKNLLDIKNLSVTYKSEDGLVYAVNDLNLSIGEQETLGFVGETGAGKTTTAMAIMGLLPVPPAKVTSGEIYFDGKDMLKISDKERRSILGEKISMIFQDPMTSLNPSMKVGDQIIEMIRLHKKVSKKEAFEEACQLLELVGIRRERVNDYPHQFSGGMKQRVVITMALLCNPDLLIADEPTTALDVTIQAQVLEIIMQLQKKFNMSLILITHDLGVVAETCDRVAIVYAGEIVEIGTVEQVYLNTKHPYTKGLFDSIPKIDEDTEKLIPIEGQMPNMAKLPSGCYFHPRCKYCQEICKKEAPPVRGENGHTYRCHFDLFHEGKEK